MGALAAATLSNGSSSLRGVLSKKTMSGKQIGENLDAQNLYAVLTALSTLILIPMTLAMEGTAFLPAFKAAVADGAFTNRSLSALLLPLQRGGLPGPREGQPRHPRRGEHRQARRHHRGQRHRLQDAHVDRLHHRLQRRHRRDPALLPRHELRQGEEGIGAGLDARQWAGARAIGEREASHALPVPASSRWRRSRIR